MPASTALLTSVVVLASLLAAAIGSSASPTGQKVLVLLEDLKLKSTHSIYFGSLEDRGYSLDYKLADDKSLRLREWDEWLYQHVIVFAAAVTEFGGAVDAAALAEFMDGGGNLILATDSRAGDEVREVAGEVGVDLDQRQAAVTDHHAHARGSPDDPTLVLADGYVAPPAVLGGKAPQAPVLFRGIGASIPAEAELVRAALVAPATAFGAPPGKPVGDSTLAGSELVLVSLVQARNNARAVIAGSIDMFSNKFFTAPVASRAGRQWERSSNREFCDALTRWALQERGVLRAQGLRHHRVGQEGQQPDMYRINDELVFALDIHELRDGAWLPYQAQDVQVEYVMLDPYVRQTLTPDSNGTFSTTIKVPDVYGIFKFVVDYKRPGLSYIELEQQAPVRPFRHDEFERFLVAAYPYYASAASTMAGFFLLGFVFLYHK